MTESLCPDCLTRGNPKYELSDFCDRHRELIVKEIATETPTRAKEQTMNATELAEHVADRLRLTTDDPDSPIGFINTSTADDKAIVVTTDDGGIFVVRIEKHTQVG